MPFGAVVGDVEETRDVLPVAVDQVLVERGPRRHVTLQDEAALRPDRHDDRVLDHLRLHEAEDLGPEVVVAVAPADPAAGDAAAAQVDALDAPRVDVDLDHRPRRRHALDLLAVDLDREHRPLRPLVRVRAQRRVQQVVERPQHLVLGQAAHVLERPREAGVGLGHRRRAVAGQRRVEARGEGSDERAGRRSVADEDAVERVGVPGRADLQQVVAHRAQHLDVAPREAGGEDEAVQRIVGRPLLVERAQDVDEALLALAQRGDALRRGLDLEAVEEAAPALGQRDRDAQLLGDGEAEVLHRLQDVGEVERADGVEAERRARGPPSARRAAPAGPRAPRSAGRRPAPGRATSTRGRGRCATPA